MKILYVARHGQVDSNDDEGAISYALDQLGHEVVKVQELNQDRLLIGDLQKLDQVFDFCLFHKWSNFDLMKRLKCPKVFWYFDLVDWPNDLTLASRCEARKRWMAEVIPLVDVGFCTDGDWVERVDSEYSSRAVGVRKKPLVGLRQGADERVTGFGEATYPPKDVLFVGIGKGGGAQRESFVADLRERYGDRFLHVPRGVYGRELANLVASCKVVVCPDSPVTDRYWSNRVYVLGGFGACLLHPEVEYGVRGASSYWDRIQLFEKIDFLLYHEGDRRVISDRVLEAVKERHLYRHRCEELVRVVKERVGG